MIFFFKGKHLISQKVLRFRTIFLHGLKLLINTILTIFFKVLYVFERRDVIFLILYSEAEYFYENTNLLKLVVNYSCKKYLKFM